MRRLDLIKYQEILFDVINAEIERLYYLYNSCEDKLTKRAFKFVINVLEEQKRSIEFSQMCKKIQEKDQKIGITDLDKILVVGNQIRALIEMKFRREDFNGRMFANAFQFFTLRKLAFKSGLPLYYIYEIGEYKDRWFRILDVNKKLKFEVKRLGNGHSRDTYAVFSTDDSLMLKEFEFKGWLKEVIGDAEHNS